MRYPKSIAFYIAIFMIEPLKDYIIEPTGGMNISLNKWTA